jgi:hypothetical protein
MLQGGPGLMRPTWCLCQRSGLVGLSHQLTYFQSGSSSSSTETRFRGSAGTNRHAAEPAARTATHVTLLLQYCRLCSWQPRQLSPLRGQCPQGKHGDAIWGCPVM